MKKTFLALGIIGALCATNGYASKQSVVVYTCKDGCDISGDATVCKYSNGKDCGKPSATFFVPQIMSAPVMPAAPKAQPQNNKSDPVSARAAKTTRPNVSRPVKPNDKSSNGWFAVECPEGCKADCVTAGQTVVCDCKDDKGNVCKDEYHTSAPSTNDK